MHTHKKKTPLKKKKKSNWFMIFRCFIDIVFRPGKNTVKRKVKQIYCGRFYFYFKDEH